MPVWGLPGASGTFWTQISKQTLGSSASSFPAITGLSGTTDREYMLKISVTSAETGNHNLVVQINGDATAAHYSTQGLYESGTIVTGITYTASLGIWATTIPDNGHFLESEVLIRAGTVQSKIMYFVRAMVDANTGSPYYYSLGGWWTGNANITQLQVLDDNGTAGLASGSVVELWVARTF